MTISIVSTTAQLIAALHGASAGDVIELAPGTYSSVNISNQVYNPVHGVASSQVTIRSEYAAQPAVLTDLNLKNSKGLAFQNLNLSTAGAAIGAFGPGSTTVFNVSGSSNISFLSDNMSGDPHGTLADTISGLFVRNSSYVTISNSNFSSLHNAIDQLDNNHLYITQNSFSRIFDDGIRGGGTSNVNISSNHFTDFHFDPTDTDHPDLIQFWTTGQTTSSSNITINSNTFTRGAGGAPQGIFIKDQVGNIPYYNVTAEYNNFTGTVWNGINFIDVINGVLEHNVVTSYTDYNSSIDVYDGSNNVLVEYNRAESFQYRNSTNLTILGNVLTPAVPIPAAARVMASFGPASAGPVPEPHSWALAFGGLALTGSLLRRRNGASTARA